MQSDPRESDRDSRDSSNGNQASHRLTSMTPFDRAEELQDRWSPANNQGIYSSQANSPIQSEFGFPHGSMAGTNTRTLPLPSKTPRLSQPAYTVSPFHPRHELDGPYRGSEPSAFRNPRASQSYDLQPIEGLIRSPYPNQYTPQYQTNPAQPQQQAPANLDLQRPRLKHILPATDHPVTIKTPPTLDAIETPESVHKSETYEKVVGKKGLPNKRPACGVKAKFREEDDQLLRTLKEDYPHLGLTWKQIADFFPGRSPGTLQVRYCTRIRKKDILWNDDTNARLVRAMAEVKADFWRQVAQKLGHSYTGEACKGQADFLQDLQAAQERGETGLAGSEGTSDASDDEKYHDDGMMMQA